MRFCIDAHAIGRRLTGNEVYVRNLLGGFAALDQTSEFIAYVSSDEAAAWVPDRVRRRRVAKNPFLRLGLDLSRKLREDRPDLVHVQYTAPLGCPVPIVVSVHDVSFLEHPEYFPRARALQLRHTVERTIRKAARILAASEFSRNAITRAYNLNDERVVAVPCAASSSFRPVVRETAAQWVRSRYGIAGPFLLTVGDLQPRKNQMGLIRAFERLIRAHPELPHRLVLVGKETWHASEIHAAARKSPVAERIEFPGFVGDDELLQFYGACDLFVFPSFYEGFGLPVLEAMACGRAVACSNTSALPETADAAAILFDPASVDDMVQAMRDLLLDAELRARMERLGLKRAARFTWEKTAQQTLDVYYDVAQGRQQPTSQRLKSISVSRS